METEEGRADMEFWKKELMELLDRNDTLIFARNELQIEATEENLPQVVEFVEKALQANGCPVKTQMQVVLAVEELYVNIAKYAYAPNIGTATIRVDFTTKPDATQVTFMDQGVEYDPLKKLDPDISLSAEEREIGGLGIYMVKKTMDGVYYKYKNGQNILTIEKYF